MRLHAAVLGEGPPVVLLHGLFLGSLAQWYFTLAPALARTHTVAMFDLRGHGRSERAPSGYDLATLAADLAAVVDTLPAGPLALVGHSYGGLVALAYARRHPVDRLVLVDTPLPDQPRDAALSDPDALLAAVPGPVRDAIAGGGRRARRLLDGLRFLAEQSTLLADLDAERALTGLDALHAPTLLVYGDRSGCQPSRDALLSALPDARAVTLPGGHFLPLECPGPLADAVRAFLAEPARVVHRPA